MGDADKRASFLDDEINLDDLLPKKSLVVGEYDKPPHGKKSTWKGTKNKVIARKKQESRRKETTLSKLSKSGKPDANSNQAAMVLAAFGGLVLLSMIRK